jgi:hypothetical protein
MKGAAVSLSVTSAANGALATLQALATPQAQTVISVAPPDARTAQDAAAQPNAAQSLYAAVNGVGQALTAADAADAAGQTVLGLLQQMREAAGVASAPESTADDLDQARSTFQSAASQFGPALAGAGVGDVNLVDGSMVSGLKVPLGDGANASLSPTNLSLGGPIVGTPAGVDTATAASDTFEALGSAIGAASGALSALRSQADQINAHAGVVQQFGQALAAPEGDGDDSVRLLALQVSQQLAAQPQPVANAAPQSVLSLFRS